MKFPVDLLARVSQEELEQSAERYMKSLLYSDPDDPERLTISGSIQAPIDVSSVGVIPLYGFDKQKMLALFTAADRFNAVGLYLLDRWWPVEDILKTADETRDGAVEVKTVGERIVLYILNRIIYRAREMSCDELPFLCHGNQDYAKILWKDGEAVGFYSVKCTGSLRHTLSSMTYQLPVMDSIFVRKSQRGKGFGLQLLEDYVQSFEEDSLGLRYPLTKPMYKVCEKFLGQYPGETNLLWEVEGIGDIRQRTNIAHKIQAMDLSEVSHTLSFSEETVKYVEATEKDLLMEEISTRLDDAKSMKCTIEIIEEVTVLPVPNGDMPVVGRNRSSGSHRRKTKEKTQTDTSEKVIRVEDIEAETPSEVQLEVKPTEVLSYDEKGESIDGSSEEDLVLAAAKSATDIDSPDPEEPVVASEETQVEDDATCLTTFSSNSLITVENVVSESQKTEAECQNEAQTCMSRESHDTVTEEQHTTVCDNDDISHLDSVNLFEDSNGTKSQRISVTTSQSLESETLTRRPLRHSTLDGEIALRGRTLHVTLIHTKTSHTQNITEEVVEEFTEVTKELQEDTDELVKTVDKATTEISINDEEMKESNLTNLEIDEEEEEDEDVENVNKQSPKEPNTVEEEQNDEEIPSAAVPVESTDVVTVQDDFDTENKEDEIIEETEAPNIETRVLRSGKKIRLRNKASSQPDEEDDESLTEDTQTVDGRLMSTTAETDTNDKETDTNIEETCQMEVAEEDKEKITKESSGEDILATDNVDETNEAVQTNDTAKETINQPAKEAEQENEVDEVSAIEVAEKEHDEETDNSICKSQNASVFLVDIKSTSQLNVISDETCSSKTEEKLDLSVETEREVSSSVADGQNKIVDATTEIETSEQKAFDEESAHEKIMESEMHIKETRVLRSGGKSKQVSSRKSKRVLQKEMIMADSSNKEVDIQVLDGDLDQENIQSKEMVKEMSSEEEDLHVVETRARRVSKKLTVTPRSSRRIAGKQVQINSQEELEASPTMILRHRKVIVHATPKRKYRRSQKLTKETTEEIIQVEKVDTVELAPTPIAEGQDNTDKCSAPAGDADTIETETLVQKVDQTETTGECDQAEDVNKQSPKEPNTVEEQQNEEEMPSPAVSVESTGFDTVQDDSDLENKDDEIIEETEEPTIETRVLRSGKKIRLGNKASFQPDEEDSECSFAAEETQIALEEFEEESKNLDGSDKDKIETETLEVDQTEPTGESDQAEDVNKQSPKEPNTVEEQQNEEEMPSPAVSVESTGFDTVQDDSDLENKDDEIIEETEEPTIETRVLRSGKKIRLGNKASFQPDEEDSECSFAAEETQIALEEFEEESKNLDGSDKDKIETETLEVDQTEPTGEIDQAEDVNKESPKEPNTVEEQQNEEEMPSPAVSVESTGVDTVQDDSDLENKDDVIIEETEEPTIETRVLRSGKKIRLGNKASFQPDEEDSECSFAAEETQIALEEFEEESKNLDGSDKDKIETEALEVDQTEPTGEIDQSEDVNKESPKEPNTVEEQQNEEEMPSAAVSVESTAVDTVQDVSDMQNKDDEIIEETEAPTIVTRVLRSGKKIRLSNKTTSQPDEEDRECSFAAEETETALEECEEENKNLDGSDKNNIDIETLVQKVDQTEPTGETDQAEDVNKQSPEEPNTVEEEQCAEEQNEEASPTRKLRHRKVTVHATPKRKYRRSHKLTKETTEEIIQVEKPDATELAPTAIAEEQDNADKCSAPVDDAVQEEEIIASAEGKTSEEVATQLFQIQNLTIDLVDVRKIEVVHKAVSVEATSQPDEEESECSFAAEEIKLTLEECEEENKNLDESDKDTIETETLVQKVDQTEPTGESDQAENVNKQSAKEPNTVEEEQNEEEMPSATVSVESTAVVTVQDDFDMENKEDEIIEETEETRVLRSGKKIRLSTKATSQPDEEDSECSYAVEETQIALEECEEEYKNSDGSDKDKILTETLVQKVDQTEPTGETDQAEDVNKQSPEEPNTVEEEQCMEEQNEEQMPSAAVSVELTAVDTVQDDSDIENKDDEIIEETEAPTIVTRVLRSGKKTRLSNKTTSQPDEENRECTFTAEETETAFEECEEENKNLDGSDKNNIDIETLVQKVDQTEPTAETDQSEDVNKQSPEEPNTVEEEQCMEEQNEEASPTRILRHRKVTVHATPKRKYRRSHKLTKETTEEIIQVEKPDAVELAPTAIAEGQDNANKCSSPVDDAVQEGEIIASAEGKTSEEVATQLFQIHNLTIDLVDVRKIEVVHKAVSVEATSQPDEEDSECSFAAEEIKLALEECEEENKNSDGSDKDKIVTETLVQKVDQTEPTGETDQAEDVNKQSPKEPNTVQEEQNEEEMPSATVSVELTAVDTVQDDSDMENKDDGIIEEEEKEQNEEEMASSAETQVEKTKAALEESKEDENCFEKEMSKSETDTYKEDQTIPEVEADQKTVEDEALSLKETGQENQDNSTPVMVEETFTPDDNEQIEEDTGAATTTDDDEPLLKGRKLRKGQRSNAAKPQGKSRRVSTRLQLEKEEETAPDEETAKHTKEAREESENEQISTEKTDETASHEEEQLGVAIDQVTSVSVVIVTDIKMAEGKEANIEIQDDQNEQAEEASKEEDVQVVETRMLRRSHRSTQATNKSKSKRSKKQVKKTKGNAIEASSEESEVEIISPRNIEDISAKEVASQVIEHPETEVDDDQPNTVALVTITDQKPVEEQESVTETYTDRQDEITVGSSTEGEEVAMDKQTVEMQEKAEGEATEEDETVVEPRILRSRQKSTPTTPRRKSKRSHKRHQVEEAHADETEDAYNQEKEHVTEEAEASITLQDTGDGVGDETTEEDEPVEYTRVLRKGRKSMTVTPRSRPKRACTRQPEDEKDEQSSPIKEAQEVASDEKTESGTNQKVTEVANKDRVEAEVAPLVQENVEEEPSVVSETFLGQEDVSASRDVEETSTTDTNMFFKEGEENSTLQNSGELESQAAGEESSDEAESVGEKRVLRKRGRQTATTSRRKSKRVSKKHRTEEDKVEQTTSVEESEVEEDETRQKHPELEGELAAEREGGADNDQIESKLKNTDETNENIEEEKTLSVTDNAEDEHASNIIDNKEAEADLAEDNDEQERDHSDNEKTKQLNEEILEELESGAQEDAPNVSLDTDELEEGGAEDISEDEVEPIVITRINLRGRSVPGIIITPKSKSRRSSGRVQKADESSSDEESSPQSLVRSNRKRRSTEGTPSYRAKRHSRV